MKTSVYLSIKGNEYNQLKEYPSKFSSFLLLNSILSIGRSVLRKIAFLTLMLLSITNAKAVIKTSTGTGSWNTGSIWTPAGVPAAGDDVIIAAGHTVTINANTNNLSSLIVNGVLIIGNDNSNRTISVTGNITINASGNFNTAGNGGNTLNAGGGLINNGIFDMNVGAATTTVIFNGTTNQTINGTGGTTDFNILTVNNTGATGSNIIEILSSNFTAVNGFLTLSRGIFKISGSFTFSNIFFNTANPVINADEGLWLNNPNVTVTAQNGDTQLYGLLRIADGTYNIGISADWWLYYYSGAELIMEGGALNISGAFFGASSSQTIKFTQSGGVITVSTVGNSYSYASFEIRASGSIFIMSGGTIVLQKAASAYTDYINYSVTSTITGGKIQAGNGLTSAGSVFWINSTPPIYDLEVKNTNSPTFQLRSATTVINDVIIWGVLDAATQNVNINVGHNWLNYGNFLPGNATVNFNGTASQIIGGTAATTFNNLSINNTSGGIALNVPANVNGTCTFTTGIVTSTSSNLLTFNDNAIATGANNNAIPSFVNGPVKKIGNDVFTFPVGKVGAGYRLCAISSPANTTDAFTAEFMRASAASLGSITASGLYLVSNCEYWNLSRTTGTSSVNVTLSWSGMSNCNAAAYVNQLSSLVVTYFNGTNWNSYGANSNTGNVSSGTVTWNNFSSFSSLSRFSLGSTSAIFNPLPVKFSFITAYAVDADNRIEWTNQTEENIDKYDLEKSTDGITFIKINTIVPRQNNGTKQNYLATDITVNNKTTFYRIKAAELNGLTTYSSIVKVNRAAISDSRIVLYPNPVTGNQFTIELNSTTQTIYTIKVINQAGQLITSANWLHSVGNASRTMDLPSNIASGIYLINISGDGKIVNSKIIVQ